MKGTLNITQAGYKYMEGTLNITQAGYIISATEYMECMEGT